MLVSFDLDHLLHTILFGISFVLFVLLAYLVVYATPKHMKNYSLAISNLLAADVMMTTTIVMTMCKIIPLDFGVAMNMTGYCTRFGQTFCSFAFRIHQTGYVNLAHLNYLSFHVRYRAIISKPFSFRALLATFIGLWVFIYAFCISFIYICSASDEDTLYRLHQTFPNETFKAAIGFGRFHSNSSLEWYRAPVLMSNMVFSTLVPIFGILYLRMRIMAVFEEQKIHLSKTTVSFHQNMMRVFTIQSITPIAKMTCCVLSSVHIFWWHTYFFENYLFVVIACIPIFNSIVNIFYVTPYRRFLFKRLYIKTEPTTTNSYTVTNSSGIKTSTSDISTVSVSPTKKNSY